jgi:Na+/melibiose symporter-like transporter
MIGFFFVFPITNFFEVPKNILFPLLISETYLGDAVLFALLISSTQLTTSLTALLMSWKNFTEKMDPAKVVLFGLIGIFVGGFMVAIPPPGILGYLIIIPILGVILSGFCSPFINITMQNIQHKVIPADKLGRVSATSTSASLSMIPPATILTGVITDFLGNGALRFMFFSSCIMGIIAIITIWFLTDLSNIKYQLNKNLENNFDKQHEIKSKQTTQPASD